MAQSKAAFDGPSYIAYDRKAGIYASRISPFQAPAESVYQYCLGGVSFDDEGTAITQCASGRSVSISYGQLKLRVQRFGLGLITKTKLKPGDTILVALHSSIDFAVTVLAAQFVGLKVALANPDYSPQELKHVYKLVKPKKVVLHSKHLTRAVKANMQTFNVILTDTKCGRGGVLWIGELLADEVEAKAAKPYLNTTTYLPSSSGTTGLPVADRLKELIKYQGSQVASKL